MTKKHRQVRMRELEMATVSLLLSPQQSHSLCFFASHSLSFLTPLNTGPHSSECTHDKLCVNRIFSNKFYSKIAGSTPYQY